MFSPELFLRELLELGAELAGEVVALLAVVPVLLPLVHILGVLVLGSPLCADESRRRGTVRTRDLARVRLGRYIGALSRSGVGFGRARLTFVAELLELVVALEVDGDLLLLLLLLLGHGARAVSTAVCRAD